MNRHLWQARDWLERIGWPGVVGLALLVFSAGLAATATTSRVADLEALQDEVQTLQARYLMTGTTAPGGRSTREEQLQTFYGFFPALSTLPDWLERIYAAAEKNGVVLEVGEYRLVQERGWRLARYQLTLPVKGSYRQVRGFVAQVLTDVPAAALDEIGFRRDGVGTDRIDVRLRLTLYMART